MFGIELLRNWFRQAPTIKPDLRVANPLAGKALRYLIGADNPGEGHPDEITVVPYGERPVRNGISVGYCNLFDESNTGRYGPYLQTSDTAREYNEGQIDPRGPGWTRNLTQQFKLRKLQGFECIELDNQDAYSIDDVLGAITFAATYGLKVIAKNPGLMNNDWSQRYVAHPNVYGVIVEYGAGGVAYMADLRRFAHKPDLPVWYVTFGTQRAWAESLAAAVAAGNHREMRVTYSDRGEYKTSIDVT